MAFLKHIQSKSRIVKTQYAFGISTLITGIIGIVWMSTLPAKFSDISVSPPPIQGTGELNNFLSNTKEQLGSVVDAVNEGEKAFEEEQVSTNMDRLGEPKNSDDEVPVGGVSTSSLGAATTPQSAPTTTISEPTPKNEPSTIILIGTSTTQKTNTTP